ncbi:MAG: mandelate racemase/muconate lactonizing enzyme family protein [Bacillota bacterium]
MKIKKIENWVVSVPLKTEKYISMRPLISREYLIVKIVTDNNIEGWGIAFANTEAKDIIENQIKPLLMDEDPDFVEMLWDKMFKKTLRWSRRGIYLRVISAVDIALWDIRAKSANLPLYKLLGGYRTRIPAYSSGGYYISGNKKEQIKAVEKEMKDNIAEGFDAVKMKVGGLDLQTDLARVAKAREVIGYDRKLFIDVNNGWKNHKLTASYLKELEALNVDWIEEPFMPDEIEAVKKLKKRTSIPIANGEILSTRWDFKQLLDEDCADIWQPDVTVVGGITEWKKIISLAQIYNIPVAPHTMHEVHIHLAAAYPDPYPFIIEYFDTTGDIFNYGKLLKNPLKAEDGYIEVPDEIGAGMNFDEELLTKYEI